MSISANIVTITEEGDYLISGTLEDGMVVVDAKDSDQVRLILDGVKINSETSAAVYVKSADKVLITTTVDSENILSNGGKFEAIDQNNIDAVIFSKSDLTLNGAVNITIQAPAGHGIVSKDDLVMTSGTYDITAASHGLSANDSIRIANGSYLIHAGKDGLQAENGEDDNLGFIYIANGEFEIATNGDGLSASGYLNIENGHFQINTGEGSESVTMISDAMGFGPNSGFPFESIQSETETAVSQKGMKADGELKIDGGSYTVDSTDDAFHSGSNLQINGGTFRVKSGDDAFHADQDVTIFDGNFKIEYCYEGVKG